MNSLASASVRSFEQMLASFSYKPKQEKGLRRSSGDDTANGGGGRRRKPKRPAEEKDEGTAKNPPAASSYVRATVGGESKIFSRYFPLPPTARSPVVLTRTEVERSRRKKGGSHCQRAIGRVPKKPRSSPPPLNGNNDGEIKDASKKKVNNRKRKKERSQRPQLSAVEKMSDAYRRVNEDSAWEPPASCHNLLQERHSFDPWRVLIICMLLNITSGKQVGKVLTGLFLLCPDAETAVRTPEGEIERVIQTLGLQRKRAKMIKRFSQEYLAPEWTHVTQLHGVGKYAADAYAIFCVGKPEEVIPEDHKLVDYWKFVCSTKGTEETVFDSEN